MKPSTYLSFAYHTARMHVSKGYRVPFTVNVQLLLKCPFACVYCPQDHQAADSLPLDVLKGVFDDARALGGRRIHLTGGEPMLRTDLPEIVRYAKDLGFFVSLTTSGVRVDSQIETIKMLDQVQLSFDGPDEARGLLRGDAAALTAQRAVDTFKEHGVYFWTSTVLTRVNMKHIDWVVDHARSHGVQANFVLMENHPEDWTDANPMPGETRDIMPSDADNRAAVRRLLELKKQGAPVGSSTPYLRELLEWEDYGRLTSAARSKRYKCMAPQSQCEILANGDLHICDWTLQRGAGVSVIEHGFRGAWERLPTPTHCNSCFSACYLESNLMFSLNPQTLMNWASRLR